MSKQDNRRPGNGLPDPGITRRGFTSGALLGMGASLLGMAASSAVRGDEQSPAHANLPRQGSSPDYRQGSLQAGITPYHPLQEDGWTIVAGSPVQSVRMDHGSFETGPLVGIWACTVGVIEMPVLPYNEFVTVYRGRVIATLDDAAPVELKPGDSFYVPKGSRIRWDVQEDVAKYVLIAGTCPVVG
ncbi:MAG: cupin domain-containing protein [Gammaproteobacteria bacterium]|nr:cupin domain-containing protein [Gammaproteobacteria bacterium]MDH4256575.1 cupin domain-containing protein [Gammaproteobacteria bacterium]